MRTVMIGMIAVVLIAMTGMAADPAAIKEQPKAQEQMPPMGPPPEMKQLENLVGTWDYVMKMKTDMASDKMEETKGNVVCAYILDGAAMSMVYDGDPLMGMKFLGFGIQTYDRENKNWQMTWTDNMGGRTSIYTGNRVDGQMVMQGEDQMGGQKWLSRMTIFDEKPTSYNWKMESSMDGGKTWMVVATATYTKRK